MTDTTEQKALALVNEVRSPFSARQIENLDDVMSWEAVDALCRAIEQHEALEAENERLRGALKTTLNLAVAYAAGTGTLFDEAMAEARAALGEKQ